MGSIGTSEPYVFEGTKGQRITIEVEADKSQGEGIAPLLIVEQIKDGKKIFRGYALPEKGNSTTAKLDFQVPESGSYRLLVNSFIKEPTGTYKLTIR